MRFLATVFLDGMNRKSRKIKGCKSTLKTSKHIGLQVKVGQKHPASLTKIDYGFIYSENAADAQTRIDRRRL